MVFSARGASLCTAATIIRSSELQDLLRPGRPRDARRPAANAGSVDGRLVTPSIPKLPLHEGVREAPRAEGSQAEPGCYETEGLTRRGQPRGAPIDTHAGTGTATGFGLTPPSSGKLQPHLVEQRLPRDARAIVADDAPFLISSRTCSSPRGSGRGRTANRRRRRQQACRPRAVAARPRTVTFSGGPRRADFEPSSARPR